MDNNTNFSQELTEKKISYPEEKVKKGPSPTQVMILLMLHNYWLKLGIIWTYNFLKSKLLHSISKQLIYY